MSRCTIPTCNQIGVKNLNVWCGTPSGPNPPKPQMSSSVQVTLVVDEEEVSFRQRKGVAVISGTERMHPVKRAPILMRSSEDGPIM